MPCERRAGFDQRTAPGRLLATSETNQSVLLISTRLPRGRTDTLLVYDFKPKASGHFVTMKSQILPGERTLSSISIYVAHIELAAG
jgi:hypothetical protein